MKTSKAEVAAVAAAEQAAQKAVTKAKAPRKAKAEREREEQQARDVWMQTTKVVVPLWFGNCSAMQGMKLSQKFGPAGALALTYIGKQWRRGTKEGTSPIEMELTLRMHGFDRKEAREVSEVGFIEAHQQKLLKQVKRPTTDSLGSFTLSEKGQKWFTLLERSAGCAPVEA